VRRVIGLDIHRTFAEAVAWEDGRLIRLGRLDMTRTALEGFGKGLRPSDEVVVEATGNAMAVVRVLSPFVARVMVARALRRPMAAARTRQGSARAPQSGQARMIRRPDEASSRRPALRHEVARADEK
jgi:transposase